MLASRQTHRESMNNEDDCTSTRDDIDVMPPPQPTLPSTFSISGWAAGPSSTLDRLLGWRPRRTTADSFGWVGEFCCPGQHWRRGEEALPHCPPLPLSYFPAAQEASPVNQTHTCNKGAGGDMSRQPPVTPLSQVLHQHLGKTPRRFGGACFDLVFIYFPPPTKEVNK